MTVLETERLTLRHLELDDAPFILKLLNEPSFLRFIGDKRVRTLDDARNYIVTGPMSSYDRNGFGLYLVLLKDELISIGICGLIKRDSLPDVDLGFAFLPEFWRKGYAFESASAVMAYARCPLGLSQIVAITDVDNLASGKVLEKLGMRFDRLIRLADSAQDIKLFVSGC